MSNCAEFHIIGRIGNIKKVGTTLRVTIASNYPCKDDRGDWTEKTRWNEITVFEDGRRRYIERNMRKGDLIRATGVVQQTNWEKDGETQYGVTLACERIGRLTKGPNHTDGTSIDERNPDD